MSDTGLRSKAALDAAHTAGQGPGRRRYQHHDWRIVVDGHTYRHNDEVDPPGNSLVHHGDDVIGDPDQRFRKDHIVAVGRNSFSDGIGVFVMLGQAFSFLVHGWGLHSSDRAGIR
jgi:hypothetical protein